MILKESGLAKILRSPALDFLKQSISMINYKPKYFNKGKTYDAKNSRSYQISKIEAFDIDNEVDLTLAEAISNTSYIKTSETKS